MAVRHLAACLVCILVESPHCAVRSAFLRRGDRNVSRARPGRQTSFLHHAGQSRGRWQGDRKKRERSEGERGHVFPLETHHRGCYHFPAASPSIPGGAPKLDVLFRSTAGPFSVRDCAIQCEAEPALPKYALLSEGGDVCECAEDLGSDYKIGGAAACDASCTGSPNSPCGSFDGEFKSVYWWSKCTEADDNPLNNRCKCAHGTAMAGEHCVEDYAQACESCDAGFTLDGEECVLNQCECPHGLHAEGTQCPVDGMVHCTECFPGYHSVALASEGGAVALQGNATVAQMTCAINECTCAAGVAATGEECATHGGAFCSNCTLPGYFMKAPGVCEEKTTREFDCFITPIPGFTGLWGPW
eukprot:g10432.t1